jgi:RNA polymerase sigma-70 factor (ECF subfamily)
MQVKSKVKLKVKSKVNLQDTEQLTDEQLVEEIRSGNREFFEELVKRYETRLIRYVLYLTHGEETAKDIVQDTFVKVYINLNSFKTDLKFSSWIYRIAHNETMNRLKKYGFQMFQLDIDIVDRFVVAPNNTESEIEKDEISKNVRGALDRLPLKYKVPLVLYYIEDKSYDEISDILKVSTGSVGTLVRRGKKRLKEILVSEGKVL